MEENLAQEPQQPQQNREDQADADKMTLLRWKAPSRPFKKRDRMFFQTIIALVFLIGAILFLMKEFLLIGVVLAVAFVSYVLATVPPEEIEHKVTIKGFENAGLMVRWEEMSEFWFEDKWGQKMVVLQRRFGFPSRIMALLGTQDAKLVKDKINEYLPYREAPQKAWVDHAADWFNRHLPFEKA